MRKRRVWVGYDGPDEILPAPDQKAIAGAGQAVVAPAEAEGASACVEVVNLRIPSAFTESLAVLAFEEGFHGSTHAGRFNPGDVRGWRWDLVVSARADHALRPGVCQFAGADKRSAAFDVGVLSLGIDRVGDGIQNVHFCYSVALATANTTKLHHLAACASVFSIFLHPNRNGRMSKIILAHGLGCGILNP